MKLDRAVKNPLARNLLTVIDDNHVVGGNDTPAASSTIDGFSAFEICY